ncbi:hypothetical protein E3N88_24799 [Mikania micrantha]|uniref:Uncharacterized protein n=1 Tax=Mikania micrantha TaxID=192012 RepID=A0A5N6N5R6_9ASTR|nr:hypothetical protein E3N88_24799 [Mikania micrantha]
MKIQQALGCKGNLLPIDITARAPPPPRHLLPHHVDQADRVTCILYIGAAGGGSCFGPGFLPYSILVPKGIFKFQNPPNKVNCLQCTEDPKGKDATLDHSIPCFIGILRFTKLS